MKTLQKAAVSAGALVITLSGLALAQNVSVKGEVRQAQVRMTDCRQGFNNVGQYPGGAPSDYECRTPVIKCPPKSGQIVGIEPGPPIQTTSGLQLRYRCTYQKQPG